MGSGWCKGKRRKRNDFKAARIERLPEKTRERERRDARMVHKLRTCKPPYSPAVMSWLSTKLHKKATKVTAEEIKGLVG